LPAALAVLAALAAAALAASAAACSGGDPAPPTGPDTPPGPCTVPDARCAVRVEVAEGVYLPAFATHDPAVGDASVTRVVVVVHGTNRNADDYFATMVEAARLAGVLSSTVIVAPHFQTAEDLPAADEAFWSSSGWKRGHLSSEDGPRPRVSSYAALDALVERLADRARFPAVREIVVTGHSAGGQVAHRYAAGSGEEDAHPGLRFRYVVANPSTYLYPGPERQDGAAWTIPDTLACPDYDDWHYGLRNLNTYMSAVGPDLAAEHLLSRDVTLLLGTADTATSLLDQSCGANLQGSRRLFRGRTLVRYLDARFPGHRHRAFEVVGVGHSSSGIYTSGVGRAVLFQP